MKKLSCFVFISIAGVQFPFHLDFRLPISFGRDHQVIGLRARVARSATNNGSLKQMRAAFAEATALTRMEKNKPSQSAVGIQLAAGCGNPKDRNVSGDKLPVTS